MWENWNLQVIFPRKHATCQPFYILEKYQWVTDGQTTQKSRQKYYAQQSPAMLVRNNKFDFVGLLCMILHVAAVALLWVLHGLQETFRDCSILADCDNCLCLHTCLCMMLCIVAKQLHLSSCFWFKGYHIKQLLHITAHLKGEIWPRVECLIPKIFSFCNNTVCHPCNLWALV